LRINSFNSIDDIVLIAENENDLQLLLDILNTWCKHKALNVNFIERYCRMRRYWLRLLYTDNCILKCLYEDMFESSVVQPNDKLNRACKVRDILFKYGFNNIWIFYNIFQYT
jgi:hypothetical protein